MVKFLLSDADGAIVGLYSKGEAVCVGGRLRYTESMDGLRRLVEGITHEKLPEHPIEWTERKVQRNKSIWSLRLPDAVLAEDVLRATARAAAELNGVLVKEVSKLGNVIY